MKRTIERKLIAWKENNKRKPLIFSGARQVGKSYSIRKFGQDHFKNIMEINFEKRRDLHVVFQYNLDALRIVSELEILLDADLQSGKTLLFFDEIQSCPLALQSLRYFYEDANHIPVIAAGSLLDFEFRNISFPVGRVEFIKMHPMNFEEFLMASNQRKLWELITKGTAIPAQIETKIYEFLDDYFFVGGMPEAVLTYTEKKDFKRIQKIQEDLLYAYENDFSKYHPTVNKDCLYDILRSISHCIGTQTIYTKMSNAFSSVTIKKGVTVLTIASLLHKVKNVSIAGLPLNPAGKQFKLLFSDIGLLCKLSGLTAEDRINKEKWSAHFKGFLAEQFVGQELICKEHSLYYWVRTEPGASSEVDYIINKKSKIIPIEVKAGDKGSLKSLHYLLDHNHHIEDALVISRSRKGIDGKIDFMPLYRIGLV